MDDAVAVYLAKAEESLAGAESEIANGRFNNCANRCYFAVFQAAIAALVQAGASPTGASGAWKHKYVQSEFVRQLINRRKQYPASLQDVLADTLILRQRADYEARIVSEVQAMRALRKARTFVAAISDGELNR